MPMAGSLRGDLPNAAWILAAVRQTCRTRRRQKPCRGLAAPLNGRAAATIIRWLSNNLIRSCAMPFSPIRDAVFKALADPTRREILRRLRRRQMSAGELAEGLDMSKPSVSHHFSVLKQADLIDSRREGQQTFYSLNTTVLEDAIVWLWDVFGHSGTRHGSKHQ